AAGLLALTGKSLAPLHAIPRPTRGALRIVIDVDAGSDGREQRNRRMRHSRTVKPCGPDISTPISSLRCDDIADDGDKKARSPGRAWNKPVNHRAGSAGLFRLTCGD